MKKKIHISSTTISGFFIDEMKKISHAFNKEADIIGSKPYNIALPDGTETVKAVKIKSNQLKKNGGYVFNEKEEMRLVIEGSLPNGVDILVYNSTLEIKGNIGENSSVQAYFVGDKKPQSPDSAIITVKGKLHETSLIGYQENSKIKVQNIKM